MKRKLFALSLTSFLFVHHLYAQLPSTSQGFYSEVISSGWNQAVGLTFDKTGTRMFVWERAGKIWTVENNTKTLMLDISPEVGAYGDLGLLGFVLDPQFDTNGFFYLLYNVDRHHLIYFGTASYNPASNIYFQATISRLTRYTATKAASGYTVNPASRKILLGATKTTGIPMVASIHGPGSLLFGSDGTLLISAGDGATASSIDSGNYPGTPYQQALADGIITPQENVGAFRSQLLESYAGKILRIDPVSGNGVPSNPFYDPTNPASPKSKIWALGLRNPFRMSRKPGTGSVNPSDGNPGTIYLGDVGHNTREELDVVNKPGMNFGWPLFEGLTAHSAYPAKTVFNYNAPNPAYGTNGCTQQYFYFRDLIKQETASGSVQFTNACNGQPLPTNIKTFMHTRPVIDWQHGAVGPSRTGTFSGTGTATTINIGAAGSPVSGPQFGGNCAVGGVFYPHNDFPSGYLNSFIFADYVTHWIRNMTITTNDKPVSVGNVIDTGAIVALAVHPSEGGLYIIDFTSTIKKINYTSNNQKPVAVASSDKTYGTGPLTVKFTGSLSTDPEDQSLTFFWNFGDGTTDTAANPTHIFSPATSKPTNYTVTLTVKDQLGSAAQTTLLISVNNTPPQATITSPVNGTVYSIVKQSTFPLRASVTDSEDSVSTLSYKWEVILHHDDHMHPEPVITTREGTATTSPYGCGIETYYYRVRFTVTDTSGLFTTKEVRLNPYCAKVADFTLVNAETNRDIKPLPNGSILDLRSLGTKKLNIRANTSPAAVGRVVFNLTGSQTKTRTDQVVPYAMFGDTNGDYAIWNPVAGNYTLKAAPYSTSGTGGAEGSAFTINFQVVKSGTVASAVQVEAVTDMTANEWNEKKVDVKYYPNPFKRRVTLQIQNKGEHKLPVKVFDVYGNIVLELEDISNNQTILFEEDLAPGIYILAVNTGKSIERYKLIKVR